MLKLKDYYLQTLLFPPLQKNFFSHSSFILIIPGLKKLLEEYDSFKIPISPS